MGEVLNDPFVDEIKESLTRFNQGDGDVQSRKHRCIFHPDDACAHNDETAGQLLHIQKLVTVEDRGAVERHIIRAIGFCASGDQELFGRQSRGFTRFGCHLDGVGVDEMGSAVHGFHVVAVELVFQHIDLVIEGHVQTALEVFGFDLLFHAVRAAVKTALAPP